jgi:hypothetical protein
VALAQRDEPSPLHAFRTRRQVKTGRDVLTVVADSTDPRMSEVARVFASLGSQLRTLKKQILDFDRLINAWQTSNEVNSRLDEIKDTTSDNGCTSRFMTLRGNVAAS